MKILIVEDEEILSKVLEEKFKRASFDTATAKNGEDAFPTAKKFSPDVVLLDLILPKKDGFQVLKELKSDVDLKIVPVIVLSNLGQDEEIKRALQLGADDFMVKTQHPINEVIEKVKNLMLKKSR